MGGNLEQNGHAATASSIPNYADVKGRRILRKDSTDPTPTEKRNIPRRPPIDWEIPRKVLHGSPGVVTLVLYFLRPPSLKIILFPLTGALTVVISADFIRLRNPRFEQLYERLLGPFMRESEKTKINGVVWYLIGVILVLSLYPRDVAVVSILILSWADTAASIFGRMYGHRTAKLPKTLFGVLPLAARKSLAGSTAAFIIGLVTAATFWGLCSGGLGGKLGNPVWNWDQRKTGGLGGLAVLSVGVGIITSITEALDLGFLDDNLTLPTIGGAAIWALARCLDLISCSFNGLSK